VRNLCPCVGSAFAPDASKPILGDVAFGLGNVKHLIAEVFSFLGIPTSGQGFLTVFALRRKNLFDQIHLADGDEFAVLSFVPRLPSALALPLFLRRPSVGLGSRSIG